MVDTKQNDHEESRVNGVVEELRDNILAKPQRRAYTKSGNKIRDTYLLHICDRLCMIDLVKILEEDEGISWFHQKKDTIRELAIHVEQLKVSKWAVKDYDIINKLRENVMDLRLRVADDYDVYSNKVQILMCGTNFGECVILED